MVRVWLLAITLLVIILIYFNYDNIRINLLVFLIVNRGLLAPNCFWWNISSLLLQDSNGVNLFNELKQKYGDQAPINVMGTDMFLITNIPQIKEILDHSPDTFCVGELKYNFFRPFMIKNVGVSKGCPWKRRRAVNETVLSTDFLHKYANYYNQAISEILKGTIPTDFPQFLEVAKKIISRVVFNKPMIPSRIFEIFSTANSLDAVLNSHFQLPKQLDAFYRNFIWDELQNPQPLSLLSLTQPTNLGKDALIDQVPHWMFPIGGITHTVSARTLVLLCNHGDHFNKLLRQLRAINVNDAMDIHNIYYLRCCILETLRLNNLVTSTFRTLCKDYRFKDGTHLRKDTQLLILNNPILRSPECFDSPNKFIPERWNEKLESSYCNLTFNQGPQKCPGKDLSLFLIESVIVHYLEHSGVLCGKTRLNSQKLDVNNIPQMIDPCSITFTIT